MKNFILLLPAVILLAGCRASFNEFRDKPSVTEGEHSKKELEELVKAMGEFNQIPKDLKEGKIKPRQITEDEQRIVGAYELQRGDDGSVRALFLDNGGVKFYKAGEFDGALYWRIIAGEVHLDFGDKAAKLFKAMAKDASIGNLRSLNILKIEPNGDLIGIASIEYGERKDLPKDEQVTAKKIK